MYKILSHINEFDLNFSLKKIIGIIKINPIINLIQNFYFQTKNKTFCLFLVQFLKAILALQQLNFFNDLVLVLVKKL